MALAPDPADKLDAAADGQFQPVNRRAGYGDQLERTLRFAKKGACLSAGEGAQLVAHYEGLIRRYVEHLHDVEGCAFLDHGGYGVMWSERDRDTIKAIVGLEGL
jgi:hypothetical protein